MLTCSRCQTENPDHAQFCGDCGNRLSDGGFAPAAAPSAEAAASVGDRCPSCGRSAPADAQFCASCGKSLGLEYASFGRRVGGNLLDAVIVAIGTSIISLIVSVIIGSAAGLIVSLVSALAYYVLLNANGGTLGKQALGMRLEHAETGEDIGIGRALGRYVVAIASGLALGLGYLWAAWDARKQTWHDKAVGSIVVRT